MLTVTVPRIGAVLIVDDISEARAQLHYWSRVNMNGNRRAQYTITMQVDGNSDGPLLESGIIGGLTTSCHQCHKVVSVDHTKDTDYHRKWYCYPCAEALHI